MTKPHERVRDLHDAKDIPAWRQLIANGVIVADKADTTRVHHNGRFVGWERPDDLDDLDDLAEGEEQLVDQVLRAAFLTMKRLKERREG